MKTLRRYSRPCTARRREIYRRLMLRDGPWCTCCRTRFTFDNPPTIEHLQPISEGGRNLMSNLVLCCKRCNEGREHKTAVTQTPPLELG